MCLSLSSSEAGRQAEGLFGNGSSPFLDAFASKPAEGVSTLA